MFWIKIGIVSLISWSWVCAYRHRRYRLMDALTVAMAAFSLGLILGECSTAKAERTGYSENDRLWLGRSLWAEAGPTVIRDHVIIPFVYTRRWPVLEKHRKQCLPYEAVVRAYSRPMRLCRRVSRTVRRCRIRRSTWEELPEGVRRVADKFVHGLLPDVCPKAGHFGSIADGNPFRFRRVFCGRTVNRFYR